MRLSCSSPMVPGETLTEKARYLKAWGYDGIAVFMDCADWTTEIREELFALRGATGITVCEFVLSNESYGHLMDADVECRSSARGMYSESAKLCAELGAITELEYEYGPQIPLPLFNPYKKMTKEQMSAFLQLFGEISSITDNSDGAVLLEPINRYEAPFLNSVDDCLDVVKQLGRRSAGLLLDFFHMAIEESDMTASIRRAGKWVRHVHLADNNRLLPGLGSIDWKGCFDALKDIRYDGFLSLECSASGEPSETLPRTADFLRRFM